MSNPTPPKIPKLEASAAAAAAAPPPQDVPEAFIVSPEHTSKYDLNAPKCGENGKLDAGGALRVHISVMAKEDGTALTAELKALKNTLSEYAATIADLQVALISSRCCGLELTFDLPLKLQPLMPGKPLYSEKEPLLLSERLFLQRQLRTPVLLCITTLLLPTTMSCERKTTPSKGSRTTTKWLPYSAHCS